ncbi:MAG: DUF6567 family protein [Chitinophagales bacterium]|nr:DUF6567 family protein [Chitinophagales bacterium]
MKRILLLLTIGGVMLLSSCGVHFPLSHNLNQTVTNVELGEKNYTVVKTVSGEAEAQYILFFGGLKKRSLMELAKKEMIAQAEMEGKSRALINVTVEEYVKSYVFVVKRKVIVTGQVVEFQ